MLLSAPPRRRPFLGAANDKRLALRVRKSARAEHALAAVKDRKS
jgi:hypothetical protein